MNKQWNDGYYLEIMDRLAIMTSNLEDFILNHPASEKHPEIQEKIQKAGEMLAEAYQDFGQF